MPRLARLDAPGILHHVIGRGIERGKIFVNDHDREDFLARLSLALEGDSGFLYCFCLMPNHFHLAIRTGTSTLSAIMRKVLTGYAISFNKRHNRSGHLFQNRFKSIVIDDERYFLSLVRYIHLNPLRARMVEDVKQLATYPWTGHSVLLGKKKYKAQDADEVLSRFGLKTGVARRELVKFMNDTQDAKKEKRVFGGGGLVRSKGGLKETMRTTQKEKCAYDERILGSGTFVTSLLDKLEHDNAVLTQNIEKRDAIFDGLIALVCERSDIERLELEQGRRRLVVSRARQIVAYIGIQKLGISGVEVAKATGVSPQSIVTAASKGEETMEKYGWTLDEFFCTKA